MFYCNKQYSTLIGHCVKTGHRMDLAGHLFYYQLWEEYQKQPNNELYFVS